MFKQGLISTRLEYFQAVVQCGSIRQASLLLGVAPSVISRSVRQLETELETSLFERINQRLKLTSAGETLAYHARASQNELERACAFIRDLQGLRRGRISVVAVESAMRGLLPRVLAAFWQRNPNVRVDLRSAGSNTATAAVADGHCDLAIAFDTQLPRKTRRLASAQLGVGALVLPEHRLAQSPQAALRDFASDRVLLADNSLTLGRLIEDTAEASGVELQVRTVTHSIGDLVQLVLQGQGVTFQTRLGAEPEIERNALAFVPLRDRSLKPRRLQLIAAGRGQLPEAPTHLATMLSQAMLALDERPADGDG